VSQKGRSCQRAYRERRRYGDDERFGDKQLNAWVSYDGYCALRRVARHRGLTMQDALDQIILEADRLTARSLPEDQHDHYYRGFKTDRYT
jgi:macrodomain Ter protein organizer (MatP/YcbG family)